MSRSSYEFGSSILADTARDSFGWIGFAITVAGVATLIAGVHLGLRALRIGKEHAQKRIRMFEERNR